MHKGEGDRREGGLDRLIYLPSDQPTYLPTNLPAGHVRRRLPRSCTESKTDRDGDKARAKHTSCSPKGD